MLQITAQRILKVVFAHLRVRDAVRHGQVAWTGIALEQRTHWRQRLEQMKLVGLVLDLVTPEDIEAILEREPPRQRLLRRCLRLCRQAHAQGGLLSHGDLAVLPADDSRIAKLLVGYEREHESLAPRRATLHDVGTGLTVPYGKIF